MAVNVGTAPERWLRGIDSLVAASVELLPILKARRQRGGLPARWVMERGAVRASAPVDALGGFPGSLTSRNLLASTTVIVTARYLVVGEGTTEGFALRLDDVRSAGVVRPSRQANPGLVVQFEDGRGIGTFALNFRGLARGLSGRHRAEEILRVLEEQGVRRVKPRGYSGFPRLGISWEDAAIHASEPVVWAGRATASVGGWYGSVQRSCRVWMTEGSLFWCCAEGQGVNRLVLSNIVEVRDGVTDRVRISFDDYSGERFDLPFDIHPNASATPGTQQRNRFLNALAACGVPISTATVAKAPWRPGETMRPARPGGQSFPATRAAAAVPMRPIRRSAS